GEAARTRRRSGPGRLRTQRKMSLPACDVPANAVHPVSHLRHAHRLRATAKGQRTPETGTRVTNPRIRHRIPASSHSECQVPSHTRIEVFPVSFGSDIRKRTH